MVSSCLFTIHLHSRDRSISRNSWRYSRMSFTDSFALLCFLNSQLRCTGPTDRCRCPLTFGLVLPANFFAVLAIFDKDRWMRAECPIREARSERNSFRRASASAVEKYFGGERAEPEEPYLRGVCCRSASKARREKDNSSIMFGVSAAAGRSVVGRPCGGPPPQVAHTPLAAGSRRSGDGAAGVAFPAALDAGAGAAVLAHPADLAGFAVRIGLAQLAACK